MRKAYPMGLLVWLLAVACRSDDVGPTPLLYKTWENPSTAPARAGLLAFYPNGLLRYGADQQEAGCCDPVRFEQSGSQLSFVNDYGRDQCRLVYCAPSVLTTGSPWTIETLNDNQLTISSNGQRITFQSR